MRVFHDYLQHLRGRGKLSLQVGQLAIGAEPETIEVPDEWFDEVKVCNGLRRGTAGFRRAVGREQGFLHLSRAGYEANIAQIRAVFEAAGGDWQEFERFAREHFETVEECTRRHADKMAAKARAAADGVRR